MKYSYFTSEDAPKDTPVAKPVAEVKSKYNYFQSEGEETAPQAPEKPVISKEITTQGLTPLNLSNGITPAGTIKKVLGAGAIGTASAGGGVLSFVGSVGKAVSYLKDTISGTLENIISDAHGVATGGTEGRIQSAQNLGMDVQNVAGKIGASVVKTIGDGTSLLFSGLGTVGAKLYDQATGKGGKWGTFIKDVADNYQAINELNPATKAGQYLVDSNDQIYKDLRTGENHVLTQLDSPDFVDKVAKQFADFADKESSTLNEWLLENGRKNGLSDELIGNSSFSGQAIGQIAPLIIGSILTDGALRYAPISMEARAQVVTGVMTGVENSMNAQQVFEDNKTAGVDTETAFQRSSNFAYGNFLKGYAINRFSGIFEHGQDAVNQTFNKTGKLLLLDNAKKYGLKILNYTKTAGGEGLEELTDQLQQNQSIEGRDISEGVSDSFWQGVIGGSFAPAIHKIGDLFHTKQGQATLAENKDEVLQKVTDAVGDDTKARDITEKILTGEDLTPEQKSDLTNGLLADPNVEIVATPVEGTETFNQISDDIKTLVTQGETLVDIKNHLTLNTPLTGNQADIVIAKAIASTKVETEIDTPDTKLAKLPSEIAKEVKPEQAQVALDAYEPYKVEYLALSEELGKVDQKSERYSEIVNKLINIEDQVIRKSQPFETTPKVKTTQPIVTKNPKVIADELAEKGKSVSDIMQELVYKHKLKQPVAMKIAQNAVEKQKSDKKVAKKTDDTPKKEAQTEKKTEEKEKPVEKKPEEELKAPKDFNIEDAWAKDYLGFNMKGIQKEAEEVGYPLYDRLIKKVDGAETVEGKVSAMQDILEDIAELKIREENKDLTDLEISNANFKGKEEDVLRKGQPPIGQGNFDEVVARERFNIPELEKISFGGSDRDVYDLGNGMVLKVAKTARGLTQNASSSDYYSEDAGLTPKTIEVGKNYLVKEKVLKPDSATKRMVKEIQELLPYSENDPEFYVALNKLDEKYGNEGNGMYSFADIGNYKLLINDFKAIRNWGTTADGNPVLIDEGTLNGDLIKNHQTGNQNLSDPEFRDIYDQSKTAKKEFGDNDAKTMYKLKNKKVNNYNDNGEFLEDFKKRFRLEFDTYLVDKILVRHARTAEDEQAKEGWGVTYNNTIAIVKNALEGTSRHEVVHLALRHVENIPLLRDQGFTREKILKAQALEMGRSSEEWNTRAVEEQLALNFEKYESKKYQPKGMIAKFFHYLSNALKNIKEAFLKTNNEIIQDYYDTLLYKRSTYKKIIRLKNSGVLPNYFIGGVLDFNKDISGSANESYNFKLRDKEDNPLITKPIQQLSELETLEQSLAMELISKQERLTEVASTVEDIKNNLMEKLEKEIAERKLSKEWNAQGYEDMKNRLGGLSFDGTAFANKNRSGVSDDLETGRGKIGGQVEEISMRLSDGDMSEAIEYLERMQDLGKKSKEPLRLQNVYAEKKDIKKKVSADYIKDEGGVTEKGAQLLRDLGYENPEEATVELNEYLEQRVKYDLTRKEIGNLRTDIKFLRETSKEIREKSRNIERRLRMNKQRVEDIHKGIKIGIREGKYLTVKRRQAMRAVEMATQISSAKVKEIVGANNIQSMTEENFQNLLNKIILHAQDVTEKDAIRQEIHSIIMAKNLSRYDNFRVSLGYPSFSTMSKPQLENFRDEMLKYEFGDVFLSPRELQTIHRTRFGDIKTARELLNSLDKVGISTADLSEQDIDMDTIKYANGTVLSEKSPFFAWLVQNRIAGKIQVAKAMHSFREELNQKVVASRKSDERTVADRAVPTDTKVFDYLDTGKGYEKLTKEQKELADFLKESFKKAFLYMQENYAMQGRENYVTHIRRGFLETLKDTGSVGQALKEMWESEQLNEDVFNLMNTKTDQVLAFEKFLPYMLKRSGEMQPSKNLAKVATTYMKAIENKKALDRFVPEAMLAVHAYNAFQGQTEKGLQKNPQFEAFVKQFVNDAKGRHIELLTTQGSKLDTLIRKFTTLTRLKFLGLNAVSAGVNIVGDMTALSTLMVSNPTSFFKSFYRLATSPRQSYKVGKNIASLFEDNPLEAVLDPASNLPSKVASTMMLGFGITGYLANNFYIQSQLTKEEFQKGFLSEARIQELANQMNKVKQNNFYVNSLAGATAIGKALTLFGNWTFPMATKMHTMLFGKDGLFKSLFTKDSGKYFIDKEGAVKWAKKDGKDFASTLFVASIMALLVKAIAGDDDDKNKYAVTLREKIVREMNTILSALVNPLNPNSYAIIFNQLKDIYDLGALVLSQEEYTANGKDYQAGDKKYVHQLKKVVTPNFIKQFENTDPADNLTPEEATIYNVVKKTEELGFNSDESKELINQLTPEEYTMYKNLKKKFYGKQKPEFPKEKEISEKDFINQIGIYAKAIGTDPTTAFTRLMEGEAIRRIDNGTIIIYRPDVADTQAIKTQMGGNSKALKLDHHIPLQLGGSNANSNLVLETNETWAGYTPVENYLGKQLRSGKISKKQAQDAIVAFKAGEITFDEIQAKY